MVKFAFKDFSSKMKLNWLVCFVRFLAISPLEEASISTKIFAAFQLVLTIWSFCFEMYGRVNVDLIYESEVTSRIVLGTVNTIIELACNIIITLPVLYSRDELNKKVSEEIGEIDSILSKYFGNYRDKKCSHIYLISLNVYYILMQINECIAWLVTPILHGGYEFRVFDNYYRYRISMFVYHGHSLVTELLRRISAINRILQNELGTIFDLETHRALNLLKDVSTSHAIFVQLIRDFNRIFGWQMLFIFLNYLCLFLLAYETALRLFGFSVKDVDPKMFIWFGGLMLYAMVGLYLATSICHRTSKEARKTADLSYFYYYNLNINQTHPEQALVAENLLMLIRQTRSSVTAFSAAGFFTIDYSSMFIMMNLLISYLIVIVQFE